MPKLKTVKNWQKEYNIKLEWDIQPGGNAANIRCSTCKEHDDRFQAEMDIRRFFQKKNLLNSYIHYKKI